MAMFKFLAIPWAASTLGLEGLECQGEDCDGSSLAQLQVKRAGKQTKEKQTTKGQAAACANWPKCQEESSCNGCNKIVHTKHAWEYFKCGQNSCSKSTFEVAGASSVGPFVYCNGGACCDSTFTKLTHMYCDGHGPRSRTCEDSSMAFFSTEFKVPLTLFCGWYSCKGVSVTAGNNLRLTVTLDASNPEFPKSIKMSEGCLVLKCSHGPCPNTFIKQINLELGSKVSCATENFSDYEPLAACQDKKALYCGTDLMA